MPEFVRRGMTSAAARKFLWDAQQAAERIVRFTANRSFENYLADDMLRAAVERQFEIIGEALGGLKRLEPETAGAISDLSRIVAFRNILIHGYASVDNQLIWGVIEGDLARLRSELERLLA
jgi:uncharacterized protein with HEPN domain